MACLICEYQTPNGLYLCNHCDTRFRALLQRVPGTLRTAQATLANMGVTPRVGSAGTSAPSAPVNLDMSTRLGEYETRIRELAAWANTTHEPHHPRTFHTTASAAEYLHATAPNLRRHEQGAWVYPELRELERRVLSAADRPLVKRPLGECGALDLNEDGTVTRCDGTILGHETATTGRCNTCRREHDVTEKIKQRFTEAWNLVAPLAVVVRALKEAGYPVKYATARKWVERGKLAPRCDLNTRQEGHTPAEVYKLLPKLETTRV